MVSISEEAELHCRDQQDGPKEIHDFYRRDREGKGTFDKAMRGLWLLPKHKVEYNVLASIAKETAKQPLEVYRFLREQRVEFIQFAPIVERMPDVRSKQQGLRLAEPATRTRSNDRLMSRPGRFFLLSMATS